MPMRKSMKTVLFWVKESEYTGVHRMYDKELAVICLYFPACITLMHDIPAGCKCVMTEDHSHLLLIITHYTAKYSDWWLRFLRIYKIIIPLIAGLMEPIGADAELMCH